MSDSESILDDISAIINFIVAFIIIFFIFTANFSPFQLLALAGVVMILMEVTNN